MTARIPALDANRDPYGNVYRLPHRPVALKPNLYDTVAEQLRIERAIAEAERTHRIVRWQNAVTVACYVLAVLVVCYFAAELGRAL